jgi:formylglycine-generating enzyme
MTENQDFGPRYKIIDQRSGGKSIVYKVMDLDFDNKIYALKVPNENTLSNSQKLKKFTDEGSKLSDIQDNNVLTFLHSYKSGDVSDACCFKTYWMDQTLEHVMLNETVQHNTVVSILMKILKGLNALHVNGYIHRDLKPSTIFLSTDGNEVRVGGLGVASKAGSDETLLAPTDKYSSPDLDVDRRSDIYSLGFIAYEMIVGQDEFKNLFQDMYNVDNDKTRDRRWRNWHLDKSLSLPLLHEVLEGTPEEVSQIISRMMSKDPQYRYDDADKAFEALKKLFDNQVLGPNAPNLGGNNAVQPLNAGSKNGNNIGGPAPIKPIDSKNKSKKGKVKPLTGKAGASNHLSQKNIMIAGISVLAIVLISVLVYVLVIHPKNVKQHNIAVESATNAIKAMNIEWDNAKKRKGNLKLPSYESAYTLKGTAESNVEKLKLENDSAILKAILKDAEEAKKSFITVYETGKKTDNRNAKKLAIAAQKEADLNYGKHLEEYKEVDETLKSALKLVKIKDLDKGTKLFKQVTEKFTFLAKKGPAIHIQKDVLQAYQSIASNEEFKTIASFIKAGEFIEKAKSQMLKENFDVATKRYKDAKQSLTLAGDTHKVIRKQQDALKSKEAAESQNAQPLVEYQDALERYNFGNESLEAKKNDEAIEAYEAASEGFTKAARKAPVLKVQEEASQLHSLLSKNSAYETMSAFTEGKENYTSAESKFAEEMFEESSVLFLKAIELFEQAQYHFVHEIERQILNTEPVDFYAGSTDTELTEAMSFCREKFNKNCTKSDLLNELQENYEMKTIQPIEIDRREVSREEFSKFVDATEYVTTAEKQGFAFFYTGFSQVKQQGYSWKGKNGAGAGKKPNFPANYLSLEDAKAYCGWKNGRVPTAEEWEFAARGTTRRKFPWGNDWKVSNLAWNHKQAKLYPVNSYKKGNTPNGILNLAGNIAEWTVSASRKGNILKGGSYLDENPTDFRSASWQAADPSKIFSHYGVRCVYDFKPETTSEPMSESVQ